MILGDALCVHEAFANQRAFLDYSQPDILRRYRKLAGI